MDGLNRLYHCSGKDLFDLAYEQINLENRNLEDLFTFDRQEKIDEQFAKLQQVFQQQFSLQVYEKQLTDHEIRALAEQCRLQAKRETYLYNSLYEFLVERYAEQDRLNEDYEKRKALSDEDIEKIDTPKIWVFRKTIEGPYYWIEKYSKEISKVYPFIRELRRQIDEIKVTNTAIEQFVSSKAQIKALKKVENYLKLKAYSTNYIQKLIRISTHDENPKKYPQVDESTDRTLNDDEIVNTEDFLDQVIEDLDIEGEVTKPQLMEWMFTWPYELNDDYFQRREEIQKKIQDDLTLIRDKARQRKEALERTIKKINVVNRLGRAIGGMTASKFAGNQNNFISENKMRRIQEEELLQKIKKTKAVIGVSDIRIRKKLRVLLSKAMQDESEREKLQELELLEKQLEETNQKKVQDKLKQKLKEQLGLDDSTITDGEEELSEEETEDLYKDSDKNDSQNQSDDVVEEDNEEPDEPEDDSFTFQGTQKSKPTDEDQNEEEQEVNNFDNIVVEDQLELKEEIREEIFSLENSKVNEEVKVEESLEQKRMKLEQQMIQNKLRELTESSIFIKRVRRKLKQMNISKTQDELKRKIIQLKMMRLKIKDLDVQSQYSSGQGSDKGQDDNFDFLLEILKSKDFNASEEDSMPDESSVSLIERISEVPSNQEIEQDSNYLEPEPIPELAEQISQLDKKSLYNSPQMKSRKASGNDFYDDFKEIKKIESQLRKRRSSEVSILKLKSMQEQSFQLGVEELKADDDDSVSRGFTPFGIKTISGDSARGLRQKKSSSVISNFGLQIDEQIIKQKTQGDKFGSNKSSPQRTPVRTPVDNVRSHSRRSSGQQDQNDNEPIQEPTFEDSSLKLQPFLRKISQQSGKQNDKGKNKQFNQLESVAEEIEKDASIIKNLRKSSVHEKRSNMHLDSHVTEEMRNYQSIQKENSQRNLFQIRELMKISTQEHESLSNVNSLRPDSNLNDFRSAEKASLAGIEPIPEQQEDEFQKFLNKIKVFDDSPDVDLNLGTLDAFSKFIYDYYIETIGKIDETKENLKLCDKKFSQALNIDSLRFAAQKLNIKVFAQRETDLMWIAQEFLVHSNPVLNEFKGERIAGSEIPLDRLKIYYFKQLVKEQRKRRVEFIQAEIKDVDDLEYYMREKSWVVIYEKGNYFKYNFHTKEQEIILNDLDRRQSSTSSDAQSAGISREISGGLISFLKKRGILSVKSQQQNNQLTLQKQQNQSQISQGNIPNSNLLKINSDKAQDNQSSHHNFNDRGPSPFTESFKLNMQITPDKESQHQLANAMQAKIDEYQEFKKDDNFFNMKPSIDSHPKQSQPMNIQQQFRVIQKNQNPSAFTLSSQQSPAFNIKTTQQQFQTFEHQRNKIGSQHSSSRPQTQQKKVITFQKDSIPKRNTEMFDNNQFTLAQQIQQYLEKEHIDSVSSADTFSKRPIYTNRERQSKSSFKDFLSIKQQNQEEEDEQQKPIRNIKRVILNNNHESHTRRQIQSIENQRSQGEFHIDDQHKLICDKYYHSHLSSHIKSPLDEMNYTLQNSANFNNKILKNLQQKVKLKPFSYLLQQQVEQNLISQKEEMLLQKSLSQQQLGIAQNYTTTVPFNILSLISSEVQTSTDFLKRNENKAMNLFNTRQLHSNDRMDGYLTQRIQRQRNDFRNMSPRSLYRWAHKSDLNYGFAQRLGIINSRTGKSSYSKLRRTQDNKITFSNLKQQELI